MKNILMIGALALLLVVGVAVYLGMGDRQAEPVVDTAPSATEPAMEEQAAGTGGAQDESDEAQVVVEESAAEPEEDEQPILLAQADTTVAPQNWRFTEGQHYSRMVPSQPTMGGADKIEIAAFFWYGCPHCFSFEPTINAWAAQVPANVRFVRIPVVWNAVHELHARIYFTQAVLARNGVLADGEAFHAAVFEEVQQRNNRLTNEDSIRRLFERFGVSAEVFDRTWKSFEVDQKMRVASDLGRRYSIESVPAVVVNGKFKTGGPEAGGYDVVTDVVDELIARESQR